MVSVISIQLNLPAVLAKLDALEHATDEHANAGLDEVLERVALEARVTHPYTNRTGALEGETRARGIDGDFLRGDLSGEVRADTFYASYLEERPEYAFLEPAYQRIESQVDHMMDAALSAAARQAGWT